MLKLAALATGKMDKITAIAMSESVKAAKEQLRVRVLPQIQGGATRWTIQGLRYWRADRNEQPKSGLGYNGMVAAVGWNYGDNATEDFGGSSFKGGGVPSGRYMELQAGGGARRAKSFELALRRSGIINGNQFLSPFSTKAQRPGGLNIDSRGNVSGPQYMQIVTRLGAQWSGSTQSTRGAGSRGRTAAKRSNVDYFMGNGYVARRAGKGPKGGTGKGTHNPGRPQTVGYRRGFVPALHIMNSAPQYKARFDVHQIAWATFKANFVPEFERALDAEVSKQLQGNLFGSFRA